MKLKIAEHQIQTRTADTASIFPIDKSESIYTDIYECGNHCYAVRMKLKYRSVYEKNYPIGEIILFLKRSPYDYSVEKYDYTMGEHYEYYENIFKYFHDPFEYLKRVKDIIYYKFIIGKEIDLDLGNFDLNNFTELSKVIYLMRDKEHRIEIQYENTCIANELIFKMRKFGPINLNVHAFIGCNGVGKTTLMDNMILSIFRPGPKRGKMSFVRFPLKKVISVLMNPLDKDIIATSKIDYANIRDCYFTKSDGKSTDEKHDNNDELKDTKISNLCMKNTYETIRKFNVKKRKILQSIFHIFSYDAFFETNDLDFLNFNVKNNNKTNYNKFFSSLGNGQKKIIINIIALLHEINYNSLIFIDEPEENLYPGLVSLYLKALKLINDEYASIMFIFTHSPVIVQQLPRTNVWKILRFDDILKVDNIWFNSLGENLGRITTELFDVELKQSLFYDYLNDVNVDSSLFDEFGDEAKSIILARKYDNEQFK